MNDIRTRSLQVSAAESNVAVRSRGMDLQEQSAVKDEARDQFRRTTGNDTVYGTSTAPQGIETSIHQSSRDPDAVRQVIIHQMNRDIELEKSTQQNAIGDSVGIRDHRSHLSLIHI